MKADFPWVGIDVNKANLDVYPRPSGQTFQLPNDPKGIAHLIERLNGVSIQQVILEATGGLEMAAAQALQAQRIAVSVINPR
ncbi:MAG TPA: hypothetical protein V6D06_17435 [Trichocoleus sp.]